MGSSTAAHISRARQGGIEDGTRRAYWPDRSEIPIGKGLAWRLTRLSRPGPGPHISRGPVWDSERGRRPNKLSWDNIAPSLT
jgi:hypothetical protein